MDVRIKTIWLIFGKFFGFSYYLERKKAKTLSVRWKGSMGLTMIKLVMMSMMKVLSNIAMLSSKTEMNLLIEYFLT